MGQRKLVAATIVAASAAAIVFSSTAQPVQGLAAPQQAPRLIESLTEPGQGLQVTDVSTDSGFVTFAASRGNGLLLPVDADAPAIERALSFVDTYGSAFGLRGRAQAELLREPTRDELGLDHVRLQQTHQGVRVRGGELIVHMRGNRVMSANGMVFDRMPADVQARYPAGAAEIEARAVAEKARKGLSLGARVSAPRLEIFSGRLFGQGDGPARTAWFFEVTGPTLREFVWIDASNGGVLLNFSQLAHAKNRSTYNGNSTAALPGTLARSEGQAPTGNAEVDNAHDLAGVTYDYFFNTHGRDSYDGLGGALISTVNHCPSAGNCPYANAFWNGTQMVYGATYASADDVVAHELTHAVTEKSADLIYYYQSGALNESFSDIFGETVDQLSATGGGNDTAGVRWLMGEDLPIGAIRNMMNPTAFGDPGKMTDPQFFCVNNGWTNPGGDSGGVHINSGVPNHAFALAVDGGTYNGQTVVGIGLDKAARIQYRTLTTYLTSGARFIDAFNGVNQACADLVGQFGITGANCTEVNKAMLAVQLNGTWNCPGAVAAPAMCSSGQPSAIFSDSLEGGPGNWTFNSTSATNWGLATGIAASGNLALYGANITATSIHNAQKTTPVLVPANAFMYFKHAFEFENYTDGTSYDGGIMEYSTNAGASWLTAQPLFDAGQNYTDGLEAGGPLPGGTQAFARSSFGYTATRLNLSTLAGQNVTFRFRVATDFTVGSLGWLVDDVSIYTCIAGVAPAITANPSNQAIAPGGDATFSVNASGTGAPTFLWQVSTNGGATWTGLSNVPPYSGVTTTTLRIDNATIALNGYRYRAIATNAIGSATSASALLTVGAGPVGGKPFDFTGDGLADVAIYRPTGGQWWLRDSNTGAVTAQAFGLSTDLMVPGDYTGDGKTDVAVYRPSSGSWYILRSEGTGFYGFPFGVSTDIPVPADYDGDHITDPAVYRPSTGTWYVLKSTGGTLTRVFGNSTDVPAVGDYDGDGLADSAIFRPSLGQWWILRTTLGLRALTFGATGDRAVPADYTGDGKTDIAVWRPSTGAWYIVRSEDDTFYGFPFGTSTDLPVAADYDGDNKADVAVFRPTGGLWFIQRSTLGIQILSFGTSTDKPVPSAFIRFY